MPTSVLLPCFAFPLVAGAALFACSSTNAANPTDAGTDAAGLPTDAGAHDAAHPPSGLFDCLGQSSETTTGTSSVAVTLKLFDDTEPVTTDGADGGSDLAAATFTPLSGISVTTCASNDPTCIAPTSPAMTSDATGEVTFTLPENFEGIFGLSGNGHLPATLYPGRLLTGASAFAPPVGLLGTTEASNIGAVLSTTFETDPAKGVGHIFVQVYDCFDRHAAGVAFSMSYQATTETVAWYGEGELPNRTATATDKLGLGGVLNIGTGEVIVKATEVATGLAVGEVNVTVTAGAVTTAWIRPRTH